MAIPRFSSNSGPNRLKKGYVIPLVLASFALLMLYNRSPPSLITMMYTCAEPHSAPDGGDCQALQGRNLRPDWACFSEMRTAMPAFYKLYQQRPIQTNQGGMRFDHSFALYYTLKKIQPETVIESGAFKGHGTWIIRQALPNARIFSLDPLAPKNRLKDVTYMVGKEWVDIAKVDWKQKGVDPQTTLVFIDDHQSSYRRSLLELNKQGFSRFVIDDNYPYLKGDIMSYKWVCEVQREQEWPGKVNDNFARVQIDLTWEQHLKQARYLPKVLTTYYEFPPVVSTELSGQTRFDPKYTSAPIVTDSAFFRESQLASLDPSELAAYTHLLYLEIDLGVQEAAPGFQ